MLRHRNDVILFERHTDLKTTVHHSTMTNLLWHSCVQVWWRLLWKRRQTIQTELQNPEECFRYSLNYWWHGERCTRLSLISWRCSDTDIRQRWSYCCTQCFFRYEYVVPGSNKNKRQTHHWKSIVIQDESILHHEDNNEPCESAEVIVIQTTEASRASQVLLLTYVRRCAQRVRRRRSNVKVFRASDESVSIQICWLICAGFYPVVITWKQQSDSSSSPCSGLCINHSTSRSRYTELKVGATILHTMRLSSSSREFRQTWWWSCSTSSSVLSFQYIHHAEKHHPRRQRHSRESEDCLKRNDVMMQSFLRDDDRLLLPVNCGDHYLFSVVVEWRKEVFRTISWSSWPNCDTMQSAYSRDRSWRSRAASRTRSHLHRNEHPTSSLVSTGVSSESRSKRKKNGSRDAESLNAMLQRCEKRSRTNVRSHNSRLDWRSFHVDDCSCVRIASNIWLNASVSSNSQKRSRFYLLLTVSNGDNHCTQLLLTYANQPSTRENTSRRNEVKRKISCKRKSFLYVETIHATSSCHNTEDQEDILASRIRATMHIRSVVKNKHEHAWRSRYTVRIERPNDSLLLCFQFTLWKKQSSRVSRSLPSLCWYLWSLLQIWYIIKK